MSLVLLGVIIYLTAEDIFGDGQASFSELLPISGEQILVNLFPIPTFDLESGGTTR